VRWSGLIRQAKAGARLLAEQALTHHSHAIRAKEKAAVAAAFSSPSGACDQPQIFLRTVTRSPWLLMRCLTTTRQ
jgi:hypothetical protein